jgi:hypothetical protein
MLRNGHVRLSEAGVASRAYPTERSPAPLDAVLVGE